MWRISCDRDCNKCGQTSCYAEGNEIQAGCYSDTRSYLADNLLDIKRFYWRIVCVERSRFLWSHFHIGSFLCGDINFLLRQDISYSLSPEKENTG